MKTIEIYKTLHQHRKLAEKRDLNFGQNKTAKVIVWIAGGFVLLYLVLIAILLSLTANESHDITAVELFFAISPFILAIDFSFRFMIQQTPAQIIKPYILLPLRRYTCINSFILRSLLSTGNLVWFAVLLPYTLMSVVFGYGMLTTVMFLLLFWILILINSQWYIIVRTFINDSMVYWLLPAVVYAVMFSPCYISGDFDIERLLDFYLQIGTLIDYHNPIPIVVTIAVLLLLVFINQRVQYSHIFKELSRTETTHLHKVSRFSFLEKFGEKGLFLQLEIKIILRNKAPRKAFISSSVLVFLLSMAISYTDIYDGRYYTNFWCIYNFVIYGCTMLAKIMCYEGNYIDGLMVRKENILAMLNAKYEFYCVVLLFPFLLMLPPVFAGKWSIWMLLSYSIFTAGFQYFAIFQLTVYNKQSVPLNAKFIGKGGIETNYVQVLTQVAVFLVPIFFVAIFQSLLSEAASYAIMTIIGIAFIVLRPLWMRNIYNRFMQRRYINLEGFRATR